MHDKGKKSFEKKKSFVSILLNTLGVVWALHSFKSKLQNEQETR